jgi:hypothetical protein
MSRIMQHHIKPTAAEAGTSSETKAPSRHKSSLSGSFPQDSRVGLTLSTRGTAISNEDGLSGDVLFPPRPAPQERQNLRRRKVHETLGDGPSHNLPHRSRNKAIECSSLSVIFILRSEHNCSVLQKHTDESVLSQKSRLPPALIGGSPTLLRYHWYKVYVPPPCDGSSTCGRSPPLHRRTCDGAEGRYSRNTVRRSQYSNK